MSPTRPPRVTPSTARSSTPGISTPAPASSSVTTPPASTQATAHSPWPAPRRCAPRSRFPRPRRGQRAPPPPPPSPSTPNRPPTTPSPATGPTGSGASMDRHRPPRWYRRVALMLVMVSFAASLGDQVLGVHAQFGDVAPVDGSVFTTAASFPGGGGGGGGSCPSATPSYDRFNGIAGWETGATHTPTGVDNYTSATFGSASIS